jgi:hypothetical protein
MITSGLGESCRRVAAQIGLEKVGRFRQHEVQLSLAMQLSLQMRGFQAEHMARMLMVITDEVQMITGYIDAASIRRRPKTHQGSRDLLPFKAGLP